MKAEWQLKEGKLLQTLHVRPLGRVDSELEMMNHHLDQEIVLVEEGKYASISETITFAIHLEASPKESQSSRRYYSVNTGV